MVFRVTFIPISICYLDNSSYFGQRLINLDKPHYYGIIAWLHHLRMVFLFMIWGFASLYNNCDTAHTIKTEINPKFPLQKIKKKSC